jgi:TonB family protein
MDRLDAVSVAHMKPGKHAGFSEKVDPTTLDDTEARFRLLDRKSADRIAELLLAGNRTLYSAPAPGVDPRSGGQLWARLRFGGQDDLTVDLWFYEDIAVFTRRGEFLGFILIAPDAVELLATIGASLPDDDEIRHFPGYRSLESFHRDSLGSEHEYVYVEELPEPIRKVEPEYPDHFDQLDTKTVTVLTQVRVAADGHVEDARIVRSVPMLDGAALECVRQWLFRPAMSAGRPVSVWVAVPVKWGR